MNPFFSIVIPVYNAEKYLYGTLNSVKEQSFTDFEVLLIDDGSTDNSAKVCMNFVNTDERFSLFRKSNGGVCSARNLGIEKANGEYIFFVDSDDIVETTTLSECFNKICESKAQVLLFGMEFDIEKQMRIVKSYQKRCGAVVFDITNLDIYYRRLYENNYITSMCNRITKLDMILENDLRFNEKITNYEDMVFSLECLRHAKKVQVVEECYYHYILHEELGMSRKYKPHLNETLPETVTLLLNNISALPLCPKTKNWASRDVQRILWIGVANICRQKAKFNIKRQAIKELCLQPWVEQMLPMESTGNKYNDICVLLYKKKLWAAETLWNVFSNYLRDIRY